MKGHSIHLFFSVIALPLLQAQQTPDFIRQIVIEDSDPANPWIYQVDVANDQGEVTSPEAIPMGHHAIFQLYGMGPDPFNQLIPHKLAEKTVGTYYPEAEVTIVSQDNHYPPRTRADQPYQLRFMLKGLADDPTAPEYARLAHLEQEFKLYDPATNVPFADGSQQHVYPGAFEFHSNGEWLTPIVYQDLPGENSIKVRGEETYRFFAYPDETLIAKQIASATIQIWPKEEAAIYGLNSQRRYTSAPTSVRVALQDLYPRSITYVQVYPGGEALGTEGYILPSTVISYNTFAPQSAMVTLDELEKGLTEDGMYTVEVVTITPFNNGEPERLAYQSFTVDRTIKMNSSVITSGD